VLTLAAFVPYVRGIARGVIKPHVFSWVIWGSTSCLVFLAQLDAGAGIGAWPIGLSGVVTVAIAIFAYRRRGDTHITPTDWAFFVAGMSALPLWYFTSDPLWAVVAITVVSVLGFGPTVRKIVAQPHSESVPFYVLFQIRNVLVVLALEKYSLATLLFPCTITLTVTAVIALIVIRRRALAAERRGS
jgi:hypothetical protein